MNDYKALRDALAAGPIEGPWVVGNTDQTLFGRPMHPGTEPIGFVYAPAMPEKSAYGRTALATSAYIAAADPTTIRQLLADLDAAQADAAKWRWLMQLSAVDVQSEYGEFTADMWNALGAVKRRF